MLNIVMFVLGWLLFLVGQMFNSVKSTSNGLNVSMEGVFRWLRFQALNIAMRVFFTVIFYPTLLKVALDKLNGPLQSAGVGVAAWGLAGLAGYMANTALFQIFGLIPWLRVEIPSLAPPPADPPKEDQSPTGPAGTH